MLGAQAYPGVAATWLEATDGCLCAQAAAAAADRGSDAVVPDGISRDKRTQGREEVEAKTVVFSARSATERNSENGGVAASYRARP